MPAGATTLGFVYFSAIKLAGYTAAAFCLNKLLKENHPNIYVVGVSRTIIGIVAGTGTLGLLDLVNTHNHDWLFYSALIPVRLIEWIFLFNLFYKKTMWTWTMRLQYAAGATIWSYMLDIPAIASAFALPGGMWIC
jgi:hypothetical protein